MAEPEAALAYSLSKYRDLETRLQVFPQHTQHGCSHCNARALVWSQDKLRRNTWTASCRRCGTHRIDLCAGIPLEI